MIARRPWLGISPADDRIKSETPQCPGGYGQPPTHAASKWAWGMARTQALLRTRKGTAGDETGALTTSHTEIVRRLNRRAVVRVDDIVERSLLPD
jgi:hypothetical protein